MPLRDHFRPPVNRVLRWHSLHAMWPGEIVRHLVTILPAGFRAAPRLYVGERFEVDVGTQESDNDAPTAGGGGTATLAPPSTATATRTAAGPTFSIAIDLIDEEEYEVRVYDPDMANTLVAAIEIVSPANKDRPESRERFVTKCVGLLQQEVCVSVVDLVSTQHANLYAELLARLGRRDPHLGPTPPPMYAVTVRTPRPDDGERGRLDAWLYPMTAGEPLPTLPIWLGPDLRVMLPLETSYEEACRVLGVG